MSKQVYILHGWTYSLDLWPKFISALEERGIKPTLLKVPGLTSPSDKVWDIEGYTSWLADCLKGQDKPVVIGHSNGGRISLAYDQRYPGKISKLILIDSAGVYHDELAHRAKLRTLRLASKVGKIFSAIPAAKTVFYKLIGAQDYLNAPENMKLTMRNMLAADKEIDQSLSKVTAPTTIIWGSEDTYTPLTDGRALHQKIAKSKLQVIDGARHAPFFSHPDKVADLISKSLKEKA